MIVRLFLCLFCIFLCGSKLTAQLDIVLQTGNAGVIKNLEFHADRKLLLSADNNSIVIWDLQQQKQYCSIDKKEKIRHAEFAGENTLVVALDNVIELWDFNKQILLSTIIAVDSIQAMHVVKDKVVLISENRLFLASFDSDQAIKEVGCDSTVVDFIVSDNQKYLGLTYPERYVVYNLETDTVTAIVDIEGVTASFIADSLESVSIATAPSSVHTYSFGNGNLRKESVIANYRAWNYYSSVSINNKYGVSGDKKDVLTIYDIKTGLVIKNKKNFSESISKVCISNNNSLVAAGGRRGVINIYDNLLNHLYTFKPISNVPTCASILDDSTHFLVGFDNGEILKWNLDFHEVNRLINNSPKKKHSNENGEVLFMNNKGGLLKYTWTSPLTNNEKHKFYNFVFDEQKEGYSLTRHKKNKETDSSNFKNILQHDSVAQFKLKHLKNSFSSSEKFNFITNKTIKNYSLAGSTSGFVYLVNKNGETVLRMVSTEPKSFFYLTNDSYYYASKNSLRKIGARHNEKLIGFEQIDLIFNRPDRVMAIIDTAFSDSLLLSKVYQKRLEKLNINESDLDKIIDLPIFSSSLNELPVNSKSKNVFIDVELDSRKSGLKALHLLINDVPVYGKFGLSLKDSISNNFKLPIVLSRGENNIELFIENKEGTKSFREKVVVFCKFKYEPVLYVLSIGAGTFVDSVFDLNYAAKDAKDISALFSESKQFKKVKNYSISATDVTVENIYNAIDSLKQATINDVVVIFYAGHGVLDVDLDYYLSTHNMDFNNPVVNGLNFDLFEEKLSELRCRQKVLLIDACHSGELDKEEVASVDKSENETEDLIVFRSAQSKVNLIAGKSTFELSQNIFVDLRSNSGVTTISSAGAAEYALEGDKWKNGAFTYCLLKGVLDNTADIDGDKRVSINELQEYLFTEVPKLTNGMQTPTSRVELQNQNFVIW